MGGAQHHASDAHRRLRLDALLAGYDLAARRASWREVYVVFALLNLVLCLPIHLWLTRLPRTDTKPVAEPPPEVGIAHQPHAVLDKRAKGWPLR